MDKRSSGGRAREWRQQLLSGQFRRRTSIGAACRGCFATEQHLAAKKSEANFGKRELNMLPVTPFFG
jgi:hypothetical protein